VLGSAPHLLATDTFIAPVINTSSSLAPEQAMPESVRVSASILAADFARLGEEIALIERSGCDEIHFDVMDGNFVPNISFGAPVLEAIRGLTSLPIDVHMMVTEPGRFAQQFAAAGADTYTVHAEACSDLSATLQEVVEAGMRAGISINPSTEVSVVTRYIGSVSRYLVMAVEPGFGGQALMQEVLTKIELLRSAAQRIDRALDIAVDGGVKVENAKLAIEAGADTLISGTGLFKFEGGVAAAVKQIKGL
jgi:ribulose-phosphate 3-epimerase